MIALLETVGWNSLIALALSVAVLLLGRFWKRPELLHVLWVVVLVKLASPVFIRIDAIPLPEQPRAVAGTAEGAPIALANASDAAAIAAIDWTAVAAAVWIAGTLLFVAVAASRVRRFARSLRGDVPPEPELLRRVETLAARIGIEGPRPRVRVVDAAVSPMVWCGVGGPSLILPARLMRRLEPAERDTLLAHELAHLKRGDCWIRWIELAVTALLWWNPVVWWVRRNLRRAEEQACDHRVLELFPRARRAYADGIVKTVEFLAGSDRAPAPALGAVGTRQIQERLTMILAPNVSRRFRRPLLPALLLALLALPVAPGFADRDADRAEQEARARLLDLEREALELEQRLHEIQLRRSEVERQLQSERVARESLELDRLAEELQRNGERDEAARLRDEAERMRERAEREAGFQQEHMDRERAMREAEVELRETLIERQHAVDSEDELAVEAYERALAEHKRELHDRQLAMREAEIAYERARQVDQAREAELQFKVMLEEQRRLAENGDEAAAAEVRERLERLKAEIAEQDAGRRNDARHLVAVRAELLARMERLRAEMLVTDGPRRDKLAAELEHLSLELNGIETELREAGTVR